MGEETAMNVGDRDHRKALERYHRDQRFQAVVRSVIHDVLGRHPEMQDRDGLDFATDVAATMLERVFSEDAELQAQRTLADHYRKLAEDALAIIPPHRMFFSKAKPHD